MDLFLPEEQGCWEKIRDYMFISESHHFLFKRLCMQIPKLLGASSADVQWDPLLSKLT